MINYALIMIAIGVFAGFAGAILGLGGGIILTPILTLLMGVDIKYAIGASIVAVIATSSGATIAYLRDKVLNLRVATFLEIATTLGALSGALLTGVIDPKYLYILFGLLLLFSGYNMIRKLISHQEVLHRAHPDKLSAKFRLDSTYFDNVEGKQIDYQVEHIPGGLAVMYGAGIASGLLGIGSGAFKVIAMDTVMKMPLKPSTSTSNLMMGVTAAASATVYFFNGSIKPMIAVPLALGILVGARGGSRIVRDMSARSIRMIFVPILFYIGIEMFMKGLR